MLSHLRTVLGIDNTFNLGHCYLTISMYRKLSVVWKMSLGNPKFTGPVMFHVDGRAKSYRRFFSTWSDAVSGDVLCAELACDVQLAFGSNEGNAIMRALLHDNMKLKLKLKQEHTDDMDEQ